MNTSLTAFAMESYDVNRKLLWGLCYRMTGNAADADDLVQETFVRAIERPPKSFDLPIRPWLIKVAINLSRDLLRKRRRSYMGPWLPSPVPADETERQPESESPSARYELLESISFAFLLALEALTPAQRAVLILRDVFDYSTLETAKLLGISEGAVKTNLHRARARMRSYDVDRARARSVRSLEETRARALTELLRLLNARDVDGLARLLADDVVAISDGGGKVVAARSPIRGRDRVTRFFVGLASKVKSLTGTKFLELNGAPAAAIELESRQVKNAAYRFTLHVDVNSGGRINRLWVVLSPDKLTEIWAPSDSTDKSGQ